MDAPKPARENENDAAAPTGGAADSDRAARWARWQAENAEAIASSNAWVEKHGLPLAKYRLF